MRRVLRPVLTLLAVLLAAAPAAQAARGPISVDVVGGTNAGAGEVPWQALVYAGEWLCGGSVLDETHVVTAAHCLLDEDDVAIPVDLLEVYAGLTDQYKPWLGDTAPIISAVLDPAYDAETHTHDAAIITLAAPGFTRADVHPVPLTAVGFSPSPGVDMTTSGWGTMRYRPPDGSENNDPLATLLQVATHLGPDNGCTVYRDYDPALHLCAGGGTAQGNCQGDSGGPLTVPVGGVPQLAGIVSAAAGCAAGIPALYTRVSEPSVHAFLAARGVGYQGALPVLLKAPSVYGETTIGSNVACDKGAWTGASAYTYRWIRSDGVTIGLAQAVRLKAGDLGTAVHCVVTARGLNGTTPAETPAFTVTQAPVPPHQTPAPVDNTPIIPPPPIKLQPVDTTPPTARLRSTRCAHKVCVLDVVVADPQPSSGVKGLDARVATAYRTTCRKGHKRRRCTKTVTKKLTATAIAKGSFRVRTPKLRAGTQTFTIVAIDQAGNRQKVAVKVRRTVR